jgi:hypothetical protein
MPYHFLPMKASARGSAPIPANAKAVGYWFPRAERATATAIFDAAAKFSNVIGVPLVAFMAGIVSYVFLLGDNAPIPDPPAKIAQTASTCTRQS